MRSRSGARAWHAATSLVAALAVVVQFALVLRSVDVGFETTTDPLGRRIAQFFSYFTIQSNILVGMTSAMLALSPARSDRVFRVLRIAALYGITVTLVVYWVALAPLVDFSGVAAAVNLGLHLVVPVLAITGWALFGPHEGGGLRSLALSLIWPAAFMVLTVLQGAATGFYPYPFVDIDELGVARVAVNAAIILVVLLAVGAAYTALSTVISRRLGAGHPAASTVEPDDAART
ncbi:Integral membrane protein [Actinomycetales bacterium JB111]|nr:Integral membrane protein [Actinomycetales bacterium JB111]